MIRFISRLLGFMLLVAGFVMLIVDGVRAIADNNLFFTPLGRALSVLIPGYYSQIEPLAVEKIGPYFWDPVLVNLFEAPAFAAAAALGVLLLWLGRCPAEPIGFSTYR